MTYNELDTMLQGRNKAARKLGNNTYAERRGDDIIAIRLHATDIMTYRKDGSVIIDVGNWQTPTIKDRLNKYLPGGHRIWQTKGSWFWAGQAPDRLPIAFTNGDEIDGNGVLTTHYQAGTYEKELALKKAIKKYAKLCADAVPMPPPSGGDCWFCALKGSNGQSVGDTFKDTEHLRAHLDEGYVVPSLVASALQERGCSPVMIAATFAGQASLHPEAAVMEKIGGPNWMEGIAQEHTKKAVEKFLRRRFGLVSQERNT